MTKKYKIQKGWEIKEGVLIQVGLEEDSSLPLRPTQGGFPWCAKAAQGCLYPPPIYARGLGLLRHNFCHVQLKPSPRSSSSRLDFCGARAEPCRNRSSPTPACRHAAGELIYFSVSLAGSRRPRSSSSCTCAERGGAVRSALGSPVIGSRRVRLPQPRSLERFRSRSTRVCRCTPLSRC